jgi:hypothetical protein
MTISAPSQTVAGAEKAPEAQRLLISAREIRSILMLAVPGPASEAKPERPGEVANHTIDTYA